jgi:fatty acid desaturase
MTTARLVEYRITRRLLQRRELESRRAGVDTLIRALAVISAGAMLSVVMPALLLPILAALLVFTLGH